jgi:putative transposase
MSYPNDLRRGRSCVFLLHAHLVFVTKYRRSVFSAEYLVLLKGFFEKVCSDFDVVLQELNGEKDHVHLLVSYPPKVALSKLVNSLKGVSSRMLRMACPELQTYYWKGGLWSPSYFAGSCGGAPLEVLKKYIQSQAGPDPQERLISLS